MGAYWVSGIDGRRRTACALAAPPPIDSKSIVADVGAEKSPILLDAKRRPLQARVGRMRPGDSSPFVGFCQIPGIQALDRIQKSGYV